MPVPQLNNVATTDAYTDALTVIFARPRGTFSLHVYNKAAFYKLGYVYLDQSNTQDVQFESGEHYIIPTTSAFESTVKEGLPPDTIFAGIQLRSGATGQPSRVTVM